MKARFSAIIVAGAMLGALIACLPALATGVAEVAVSADVTAELSGVVVRPREVALDDLAGGIVIEGFGGLADAANVDAYHKDGCCAVLFSTDTAVALSSGATAAPEDIVRLSAGGYALEFDGSVAGIPAGANVDAVARLPGGDLAMSFDVTVDLGGGLVAADEDLVSFDGAGFSSLFDGSAFGIEASLDVDGVHSMGGSTFALSLDGSGAIGGVKFDDEDVLVVDAAGQLVAVLFDTSGQQPGLAGADVDALAVPEPGLVVGLAAGACLLSVISSRRAARHASR